MALAKSAYSKMHRIKCLASAPRYAVASRAGIPIATQIPHKVSPKIDSGADIAQWYAAPAPMPSRLTRGAKYAARAPLAVSLQFRSRLSSSLATHPPRPPVRVPSLHRRATIAAAARVAGGSSRHWPMLVTASLSPRQELYARTLLSEYYKFILV